MLREAEVTQPKREDRGHIHRNKAHPVSATLHHRLVLHHHWLYPCDYFCKLMCTWINASSTTLLYCIEHVYAIYFCEELESPALGTVTLSQFNKTAPPLPPCQGLIFEGRPCEHCLGWSANNAGESAFVSEACDNTFQIQLVLLKGSSPNF